MLVDYLKKDLGLKIFALILALVFWAYVKYTSSPQSVLDSEAQINVPLIVDGVSENLVPLNVPSEVALVVEGDPQILAKVKPANFKAFINMTDKTAGSYSLPIKVTTPPDIKVAKMEPSNVQVKLDPLTRQLFTVKVKPNGSVSSGFVLNSTTSQPESVKVTGAQSLISRVKEIRASCDVDKADMDLVQRVTLDAYDENDQLVENLAIEPRYVRALIRVRPEVKNAIVPISASITGNPASGFSIGKVIITPTVATVRYQYTLENPPTVIKTEEISIEGTQASVAKEIGLVTPPEVSLVEPSSVKIHIMIASPDGKTEPTAKPKPDDEAKKPEEKVTAKLPQ